jgi:hypothetical protein
VSGSQELSCVVLGTSRLRGCRLAREGVTSRDVSFRTSGKEASLLTVCDANLCFTHCFDFGLELGLIVVVSTILDVGVGDLATQEEERESSSREAVCFSFLRGASHGASAVNWTGVVRRFLCVCE